MQEPRVDIKSNKPSNNDVVNTQQDKSIQFAKVIDLIRTRIDARERFYSIEVTHFDNLSLNFDDFAVQPLFTSVTWLKDNVEVENEILTTAPAVQLLNAITSTPTILHLTCYKLTEGMLDSLMQIKLSNVLAMRGDIVTPNQPFKYAIDLVRQIKRTSVASVSVGGYPDVHPEALSPGADIKHLLEKVDAGADFIITQMCFSSTAIIQFIEKCRNVGITVPIVPGIFIPPTFNVLTTMCRICKVRVPAEEFRMYKLLQDNEKDFQDYAVGNTIKLLNDLFHNDGDEVMGVHLFTLNNFELMNRVTSNFDFK